MSLGRSSVRALGRQTARRAPPAEDGVSVTSAPPVSDASALQRARALVLRHGWNATAYQILNPGISLWFSRTGDAVTGFVRRGAVRVVAGAPVCAEDRLAQVSREFEADAARVGARVCYFGAEARLESLRRDDARYSMVSLGAQPAWHPAGWSAAVDGHRSLRAQLARARNKGVRAVEWLPARASASPVLRAILEQWLATRGLPPLHFLVEPETLARLFDRRIFVAEREGSAIAFLVASPVPCRDGWLVEQAVRGAAAPNGTMELLIDAAVRAVAAEGAAYVTLGLSPLSRRAAIDARLPRHDPLWLRLALRWARAHGRRFYDFDGLDAFKAKFRPEFWEPVYAVANEPRFSPSTLHAVAAAFGGGSPTSLVLRGVGRAARIEARRLLDGARGAAAGGRRRLASAALRRAARPRRSSAPPAE